MKINIICVGKIKEKFFRDGLEEYLKRLSRYCKISIVEVNDEQTPDQASEAFVEQIKCKEAQRILSRISEDDFVVTLEILGKQMTSEELAAFIEGKQLDRTSTLDFVIGGSLGLHETVMKRSNMALSFSKMTFPHQLMRVILAEQIYRAYRIIQKEPYHK